jgi:hypothetical protein
VQLPPHDRRERGDSTQLSVDSGPKALPTLGINERRGSRHPQMARGIAVWENLEEGTPAGD